MLYKPKNSEFNNQHQITDSEFKDQRQIVKNINKIKNTKLNFAYWDIFPVRTSDPKRLEEKFMKILEKNGSSIFNSMLDLTRLAIEITKPKAVCACNSIVRDMAIGKYKKELAVLADIWNNVKPLPLSHPLCYKVQLCIPNRTRKFKFCYNTMKLHDTSIPVLLGIQMNNWQLYSEEQVQFITDILCEALDDPERYYDKLSKRGQTLHASRQC